MVEIHIVVNGNEHVLKYVSDKEAKEIYDLAGKYGIEVRYNPICIGCARKGKDCTGTKNFVWTGCVYREKKEGIA